jgi:hypothetical protein
MAEALCRMVAHVHVLHVRQRVASVGGVTGTAALEMALD